MRTGLFLPLFFFFLVNTLNAQEPQHTVEIAFQSQDEAWKKILIRETRIFLRPYKDLKCTVTFRSYLPAGETYSLQKDGTVTVEHQDASLVFEIVSSSSQGIQRKQEFTCSGGNHQLLLLSLQATLKKIFTKPLNEETAH